MVGALHFPNCVPEETSQKIFSQSLVWQIFEHENDEIFSKVKHTKPWMEMPFGTMIAKADCDGLSERRKTPLCAHRKLMLYIRHHISTYLGKGTHFWNPITLFILHQRRKYRTSRTVVRTQSWNQKCVPVVNSFLNTFLASQYIS